MKLEELAYVRSGLVLGRKSSKSKTNFAYPLLNLRCIHPDGYIQKELCEQFYSNEALNRDYLTATGDVLIRLTSPYTAVLINKDTAGYVIPSSFVVVRVRKDQLLPEYLIWLLNSPNMKRQLYTKDAHQAMGAVKPRYFAELEMKAIPLFKQQAIAELNALAEQECQLLKNLSAEKKKLYDQMIGQIYEDVRREAL